MAFQLTLPEFEAFDYESKIVSTTAVGLTGAKISPSNASPAQAAFITVETASIRFRLDGATPTATEGHLAEAGDALLLYGINTLRSFQAIRATTTDAMIRITFLR